MDMTTDDSYLVFGRPHFGSEDIQEVVDSLESGWVGTGPKVAALQIWAHGALRAGWSIGYVPTAEALHTHVYALEGLLRRSYCVGRVLQEVGLDGGATERESIRFLSDEITYFVRQRHVDRLPQLLPYELLRRAGLPVGRSALRLWRGTGGWWAVERTLRDMGGGASGNARSEGFDG